MSLRGLLLTAVVSLCVSCAGLVFASAPVLALDTHVLSFSFGSAGSGAGQMSSPTSVAVNLTTHDVYVADSGNFRIDQFSSSGSFIRAWGWGVADGLPSLETCTLACQTGLSSSAVGGFKDPTFIAVDNSAGPSSGDVYVGDTADNLVTKFDPAGKPISGWGAEGQLDGSTATNGPFGSIAGVAVDSAGQLMVLNGSSRMFEFAQNGDFNIDFEIENGTSANGLAVAPNGNFYKVNGSPSVEAFVGSGADVGEVTATESTTGLAVDQANGDLYVDEGRNVAHYVFTATGTVSEPGGATCTFGPGTGGCAPADAFASGVLSGGRGIGFDSSNNSVFVADASADKVDVFVPGVVPDVATESPLNVQPSSATFSGTINPDGVQVTACQFEYSGFVPGTGFVHHTVPCAQSPAEIGSGTSAVAVSADVSGLRSGTKYEFRLEAANSSATNQGQYISFVAPAPPKIYNESASNITHTRATLEAKIGSDGADTSYHFEYGTTAGYGSSIPVPEGHITIAEGGSFGTGKTVSENVEGLQMGVTYHYRVAATNSAGTEYGEDEMFTALPPALISSTSAANVGTTSATLYARINPLGNDTTYHIEYGATTNYGTSVPVPDASIGAGESDIDVSDGISGLREDTLYHFRVFVSNLIGTFHGPDRTFVTQIDPAKCPNAALRTGPSAHLPDCRAYELVTPADKKTASQDLIFTGNGFGQTAIPAPDGDRVAAELGGVAIGSNPTPVGGTYIFVRTASGWATQSVNPVGSGGDTYSTEFFSTDLTQVAAHIRRNLQGFSGSGINVNSTFAVGHPGGPFAELATVPPLGSGAGSSSALGSASADLSTVILSTQDHSLLGGPATGTDAEAHDLYQWANGNLSLVNVTTAGSLLGTCGANDPWVSGDGSRVFFRSPDPEAKPSGEPGCQQPPQFYMRTGNETVEISAPEPGVLDPAGPQEVTFVGASADGSKVFFISKGELTADDLGRHDDQLYEYNAIDRKLTRISAAVGGLGEAGAWKWVIVSEDGSTVYFHDENNQSLYSYDTSTGTTQFVATALEYSKQQETEFPVIANEGAMDAATPDGRFFIFESKYVTGVTVGEHNGPDELYRYDAANSSVICVSCPPNNNPQDGGAYFHEAVLQPENRNPRYVAISDDGNYVFFQSNDHLVSQDVNQIGGGNIGPGSDVYEWHNGTISLISSGNDPHPAVFLGATPNGSDIFFGTHAQLVPQDTDTQGDIYDARIDGGFPTGSKSVPCVGDACHNPASQPNDATPSSSTFSGPGNPTPGLATLTPKSKPKVKKCGKGMVRKKGRCVKKRKAKRAARRSSKHGRGGSK